MSQRQVERMAEMVTRGLVAQGFVRLKVDESKVTAVIAEILSKSFAEESALEAEAEQMAQKLAAKTLGMDRNLIVRGILERLARERNFPL